MKRLISRVLSAALSAVLLAGTATVTAGAADVSGFKDVSGTAYYADAVQWAVDHGVTAGTSDTQFSPYATVTRAQAVTFLWAAAGRPEPQTRTSPFDDVADSTLYYYKPVLWAVENGITAGVSGTQFGPGRTLAYDQIFLFLCRAAGDVPGSGDWSAAAVQWARSAGLTSELTFSAKDACPRADVVYCLWKQMGDGETGEEGQKQPEEEQKQPEEEQEQPQKEQKPTDPERPSLTNEAGATLAITTGFLDRKAAIDISGFGLEASQAEKLAMKIADMDGENPYGITHLNAYEQDGEIAKTLAVYYTNGTVSITTVEDSDWRYVSDEALAEADRVVDEVVTAGMSDYDVVKALHDYLVTHCDYDYRVDIGNMPFVSHQAEGALLEGTAVCSGYAKAYEILLDAAGIPNETITGYAGGYHAWNLVQVDGQWYHVDTTWDDPTTRGGDYIRYTYFLKSDRVMVSRSHRDWEAIYSCTSTKYDQDLLDSVDQERADTRQEQVDAILAACAPALTGVPTWTQEELQALSDQQLSDALYFTIDLSGAGFDSNTLSKYRQEVADAVIAQHPEFAYGSFSSQEMSFQFRRDDVAKEQQRRQDAAQAEKEQQQNQDEATAQEIVPILEKAIAEMDCYTTTVTLSGYTDGAIKAACDILKADGHTFDGYTYRDGYNISVKSGGMVTLTNYKWAQAEEQRYLDQINAAIDSGELELELQPGSYPDKPDKPWYYASQAARTAGVEGYTTPGGRVAGTDYTINKTAIRTGSNAFFVQIRYLNLPELDPETAVEDYIAQIQDAIRSGETELLLQYEDDVQQGYIREACQTVNSSPIGSPYSFDGYTAGEDYWISYSTGTAESKIFRITIGYPTEE